MDAENGSGQMMPEGLGAWEVLTSFPLSQFVDPYPTNKQNVYFRTFSGYPHISNFSDDLWHH